MWTHPKSDRERRLVATASASGGYFTAKQALNAGYSYRLQNYYRAKGHWEEIERGIFRFMEYPFSDRDDLIRWSLWSLNREGVPQAVVSHDTALSVHGLSDLMPAKVHLTVPAKFRKVPPGGVILHRGSVEPGDLERRDGFLVTKPLKTIVDVAESAISVDYLEQAVRDAFKRGMVWPQELESAKMSAQAREKIRPIVQDIKKRMV